MATFLRSSFFSFFPYVLVFPCLGSWLVSWRRNCFSTSLLRPPGERTESLSHFERKMSRDTGCMTKCWRRTVPFEIIWPFLGFLVLGLISILFAPNQAESCPSIASTVAGCEKWKLSARQFMGAPGLQHFPMQLYPESENRACRNLLVRFPNFSHSWLRGGGKYYCDKWDVCFRKGRRHQPQWWHFHPRRHTALVHPDAQRCHKEFNEWNFTAKGIPLPFVANWGLT